MKLIGKLWLLFFVAVVLMGVVQFSPSNIHTDIRALLRRQLIRHRPTKLSRTARKPPATSGSWSAPKQ